jgi:phage tail sheath protein FI
MPEYLSPHVYIEEVDTGPKPIEGVSTSTAGVIGVTERGPVDVPILVTSAGEYQRWFGQALNMAEFGNHCFLPHAIDGFFGNGGKRVYVTRILNSDAAAKAHTDLFEVQDTNSAFLLAPATAGAKSLLITDHANIAKHDWVRIGSGSDAEYRQVGDLVPPTTFVTLRQPVQLSHSDDQSITAVEHYTETKALGAPGATLDLGGAANTGATSIVLIDKLGKASIKPGQLLRINNAGTMTEELIYVAAASRSDPTTWVVTLRTPLQIAHADPDKEHVDVNDAPSGSAENTKLTATIQAGTEIPLIEKNLNFTTRNDLAVFVDHVDVNRTEARRIGTLALATLGAGAYEPYAAGWRFEHVTRADAHLTDPALILDAAVPAGALTLPVNNRNGLKIGDVIRVGDAADPNVEYVVIRDLPNKLTTDPDPGRIVLEAPLQNGHGGASSASRQIVALQTLDQVRGSATLALAAAPGDLHLVLTDRPSAADGVLRITSRNGSSYIHRLADLPPFVPQTLKLQTPLSRPHNIGGPVVKTQRLLGVFALDPGAWGNRLRVAAAPDATPRARTRLRTVGGIIDPTHIRLDSPTGVEPGTLLRLADAQGNPTGTPFKAIAVDRQNDYLITLAAALPGAAMNGSPIVSLEFRVDVYLLRQPDPALPSRNAQVLDTESFRSLSLDPRHSRYLHRIIGTTWTESPAFLDDDGRPLRKVDHRSEGESQYIRVRDLAQDWREPDRTTELQRDRLGPEFLIDVLPDGRERPARFALMDGDDQVPAITDQTYIGNDAQEPRERTGLQTLKNLEEVSIIAAPGRNSVALQSALVNQCELMRYRFAVLDGVGPPDDTLVDVQNQRQQFDTKYAALYHPWLVIPDPYPANGAQPPDLPIPSAGHLLGIYARTDIERGVHKAPANEVVRGVTGLARTLNQEQHDILNPYPVNINVIRDFRSNNRGIRVYGGRCITSDSDWKYVNVRRLLIFIEASIDRGLQWVVFEPNAEPLWARVRRSITNFLIQVWRNGGLEGTKPEEAFFVKCDRTTMTQTDIDEGRLICLVGVAPVKPAEFVIVRIGLWTAHADDQ